MKTAIISDSHDSVRNLKNAIDIANKAGCYQLFHLGDIIAPYTAKILENFKGNSFFKIVTSSGLNLLGSTKLNRT